MVSASKSLETYTTDETHRDLPGTRRKRCPARKDARTPSDIASSLALTIAPLVLLGASSAKYDTSATADIATAAPTMNRPIKIMSNDII